MVVLQRNENEVGEHAYTFGNVAPSLSRSIKVLMSDRGGDYFSTEFDAYWEEYGIIHECFTPHTP